MTTIDLLTERNEILDRLEKRWRWLDANPNHPQYIEREDACLADLADYERLEGALTKRGDVVVTVPKRLWDEWIAEGDLPGDEETGEQYAFSLWGDHPDIEPGERVYVVAHGKLRGYAPLTRIAPAREGFALIRAGGAVACTIDEPIRGFRGWQYRWWDRADEKPFPDWRTT